MLKVNVIIIFLGIHFVGCISLQLCNWTILACLLQDTISQNKCSNGDSSIVAIFMLAIRVLAFMLYITILVM
jgi:hypothetical protein